MRQQDHSNVLRQQPRQQNMMAAAAQMTPDQFAAINMANRQAVVTYSIRKQQQIFTQTFNPTSNVDLTIQPNYAGLLLGFFVEVSATVTVGTNNYLRTAWGPANLIRQCKFNDLSNNTRIQTTGMHLNAVNTAKAKFPYLAAASLSSYPIGYGNTFTANIAVAPATLTTAGATLKMMYWVPCAYSELDLRGAVWVNVVNATCNLQLSVATSAQAFVAQTADPTLAVYQADATGATGVITSYTVTVHQVYYDQLPVYQDGPQKGAPVLPIGDLSTMYQLWNTANSGLVTAQDFNIPYANFRSYLSTVIVYDNQTGGAYPAAATDVNYWMLQTANFTNIFKYPGWFPGVFERLAIMDDFPLGSYYFDSRAKPINTIQFGNQQLILNPNGTVNTGANVIILWEYFSITNTLIGAASLAGSGS